MNEKLLKIISAFLFAKGVLPKDFKLEYVEDKYGNYFKFNIDLSKMDVNSPNYDESYAKYFTKPKGLTGLQSFTYDWNNKMSSYIDDFLKISGAESRYGRSKSLNIVYNYDYLDNVSSQIEEKIKETNYPNVTFEFDKDSNPDIRIIFRNFEVEQFVYTQDFVKELKELLSPNIDLDAYTQLFTRPRK